MAKKSPKKQKKALEKKKARAKVRAQTRKSRGNQAGAARKASMEEVSRWDWAECYVTDNWLERGAQVECLVQRRHHSEVRTAVIFKVDLAEGGITWKEMRGVHPGEVQQEIVRRSQITPMVMVQPESALAVLEAALRERERKGLGMIEGFPAVREIFGGLFPDESEILTGTDDDPGDTLAKPGFWQKLRGRFGV